MSFIESCGAIRSQSKELTSPVSLKTFFIRSLEIEWGTQLWDTDFKTSLTHICLVLCRMWKSTMRKLFVSNLVLMLLGCKRGDSCILGEGIVCWLHWWLLELVPRSSLAGCCQTGPWPATFGNREIASHNPSGSTGQRCVYSYLQVFLHSSPWVSATK